jgi:hypothetical protein
MGQTKWSDITEHREMVEALIKEHSSKYHQTENTPPMRFPVQHQLGYLGIGKQANEMPTNASVPASAPHTFPASTGCFAVGTDEGFRIYNCEPFKETFRRDFSS